MRSFFNAVSGKSAGPKPAIWSGLALTSAAGAIGVGTAVAIGAWPLSAAFFAASLVVGSISSAVNAAGSVSSHRHFAKITKLEKKNLALQKENMELEKKHLETETKLVALLEEQQRKSPVSPPVTP